MPSGRQLVHVLTKTLRYKGKNFHWRQPPAIYLRPKVLGKKDRQIKDKSDLEIVTWQLTTLGWGEVGTSSPLSSSTSTGAVLLSKLLIRLLLFLRVCDVCSEFPFICRLWFPFPDWELGSLSPLVCGESCVSPLLWTLVFSIFKTVSLAESPSELARLLCSDSSRDLQPCNWTFLVLFDRLGFLFRYERHLCCSQSAL